VLVLVLTCLHRESKNILEAASNGASCAVSLVANIVANIIAFLALLCFFDSVLSWFGGMFDCPQLSFSVRADDHTRKHTHVSFLTCSIPALKLFKQ